MTFWPARFARGFCQNVIPDATQRRSGIQRLYETRARLQAGFAFVGRLLLRWIDLKRIRHPERQQIHVESSCGVAIAKVRIPIPAQP